MKRTATYHILHLRREMLCLTIMLLVMMGTNLALAADNLANGPDGWGSRVFMIHADTDDIAGINEAFADLIVPINQTFESDALKVTVIDAAYDGRSAVISWTVENKLESYIFLFCDPTFNGERSDAGNSWQDSYMPIDPGETITSALSTSLVEKERYDDQTCEIILHFTALAPTGPLVTVDFSDGPDYETIDALIADGKVPVNDYGAPMTGDPSTLEKYDSMEYKDILVEMGIMKHAGAMDASFVMENDAELKIGVWDRPEVDRGKYRLRLVEASKTPNTVAIVLDAVFEDESAARQYEYNPLPSMQSYGSPSMIYFKDGDGNDYFTSAYPGNYGFGAISREPVEQPDGTWAWRAMVTASDFSYADDICQIFTLAAVDPEKTEFEEQVITITFGAAGDNEASVDEEADARERAKALNMQLGRLQANIQSPLRTIDPNLGSYVLSADSLTQEEYDDLSKRIAEVESYYAYDEYEGVIVGYWPDETGLSEALRLIRSLDLTVQQPTDAIIAFVDAVLKDIGYNGLLNRSYRYRYWLGDNESFPGWEVVATDGDLTEPALDSLSLSIIGDDRLVILSSPYPGYIPSLGGHTDATYRRDRLTQQEKQALKERATAFYEQNMFNLGEPADVVLVSDFSYGDKEGRIKSYASVWICAPVTAGEKWFESQLLPKPYNEADPGSSLGTWLKIQLETGKILSVMNAMRLSAFVNESYAETDWVSLTGQAFPIRDESYFANFLGKELTSRYEELTDAYLESLTDEERLIIRHILTYGIGDENAAFISSDMDWDALLSDLRACDSAEAFKTILYGDYVYFNQSPSGEPTRDEILKAAEPAIAALGYGDMPLRSFMYTGPLGGGGAEGHDIVIADTYDEQKTGLGGAVIASFDSAGKVRDLQAGSYFIRTMAEPSTEAEREKAGAIVWEIAAQHLGFAGDPIEGSVRIAENVGHNHNGERVIKAYFMLDEGAENAPHDEAGDSIIAVGMIINAESGQIVYIARYDAAYADSFLNSWN